MFWLGFAAGVACAVFAAGLLGVLGALVDRLAGESPMPGDRGLL